jgi:Rap1a immunity proteins
MKRTMRTFMLGLIFCGFGIGAQMNLGDLYQLCTSPDRSNKSACTFYILGVFEGAQIGSGTVRDKSGVFQEGRNKSLCVPEGLTSAAMELTVKTKMGADLAVYPEDRSMPAVSFLVALMASEFPCQIAK